ncbi:glycosyltransferase family 4 protein [Pelotomaculum propionicicum]|uniref:D-inositol 3-phosphate glycosyltransferase n=1 Tax=Pelotomaculum propionicicum TaxID=258475 RepID=A0A4Y7RMJ9_9FIRM|nr:glycosyltransferase family 4 protein [Pelotomaculum propionicicum]NLI13379.1 glycosyltransferase family 4 protein [Peptococcaceae bacterium]TEB09527.1 D-inositol 3-phosphate glycosyltransferase [Pelotomaculum propionicicum]
MDCLQMGPFYNAYLLDAIKKYNHNTNLGAVSFHLDEKYIKARGIENDPGLIDLVGRLKIKNKFWRQSLKAIEYCVNLLAFRLRFALRKPDIVHIQWLPLITHLPFEYWFLQSLKRQKIKLVYTVHNVLPHDTGRRYFDTFYKVYRLVDALICHTRVTKARLVSEFSVSPSKIHIVPHGPVFHDVQRITVNAAKDYLNIPRDLPLILFLGTLRPYKGLEFLLAAWRLVVAQRPETLLIIAGEGEAKYKRIISSHIVQTGLKNRVKTDFRFIPVRELPLYYQAADILVYPYKEIEQSGALFTGMAFAKPIVATTVGGIPEVLIDQHNGLLVDYGNKEAFSKAVVTLIDQLDLRMLLGRNALQELQEKYSWDVIAKETLDCYREIM